MTNFLPMLERLSSNVVDSQISHLNPSSMLFYRLKDLKSKSSSKLRPQSSLSSLLTYCHSNDPHIQPALLIPHSIQSLIPIHVDSIKSLIKILDLMNRLDPQNATLLGRLEDCLIRKICLLKNAEEVLQIFTGVVYARRYLQEEKSRLLEDRMVKELMNISFKTTPPSKILRFVMALPFKSKTLLPLLSHFMEQIEDEDSIKQLYQIFSQLFPSRPTSEEIRYLLSVPTKQVTEKIPQMIKNGDILDVRLLEEEAKKKLKKVPSVFNSKGEAIMLLVFFVVFHGGAIWMEIIEWEKTAIQEYKDWLKSKAESIVNNQKSQKSLPLILHNLTNVNYESEISELFFDHVINKGSKEMINSIVVRNFLASKLLYKFKKVELGQVSFSQSKLSIFFTSSLVYTDVLLQLFANENQSYSFYSFIISNSQTSHLLIQYLNNLYDRQRFKFMEFFCNFQSSVPPRPELLMLENNKLIHYYLDKIDYQLAYLLVKELSSKTPQKFYFLFIRSWLTQFVDKIDRSKYGALKAAIVRNINILLVRADVELSSQFITDFKQNFYPQLFLTPEDRSKLLMDVPQSRRLTLGV